MFILSSDVFGLVLFWHFHLYVWALCTCTVLGDHMIFDVSGSSMYPMKGGRAIIFRIHTQTPSQLTSALTQTPILLDMFLLSFPARLHASCIPSYQYKLSIIILMSFSWGGGGGGGGGGVGGTDC